MVDEKKHIARAAGLMSIATFISRVLGFVKDMILARFFGATGIADTFFVAFRIPSQAAAILKMNNAVGALRTPAIVKLSRSATATSSNATRIPCRS